MACYLNRDVLWDLHHVGLLGDRHLHVDHAGRPGVVEVVGLVFVVVIVWYLLGGLLCVGRPGGLVGLLLGRGVGDGGEGGGAVRVRLGEAEAGQ